MNNQDLNQINLNINLNIQNFSHSAVVGFTNQIKKEAKRFVISIKPEILELVSQLRKRDITCNNIEEFLHSQIKNIDLSFLKENNISDENIDEIKGDILRLIASAIMNSYLNSLFRSQKSISSANTSLFLN